LVYALIGYSSSTRYLASNEVKTITKDEIDVYFENYT
jgi:hypothetical protein